MKDSIIYVHGKGGSAEEADHYKAKAKKITECAQYPMWCEGMPALLFGYVRYLQVPEKENREGLDENEFMKNEIV